MTMLKPGQAALLFLLALLLLPASGSAQAGVWLHEEWNYSLDFGLAMEEIEGDAVTVFVDFASIMREAGIEGELDPNSPRVVRVDDFGNDQSVDVPAIFEERLGTGTAWGYLTWLKGKQSHHQIYFDTAKAKPKPPAPHAIPEKLAAHAVNLVRNPGFEIDGDGDRLPDLWGFAGNDLASGKWVQGPATSAIFALADAPVRSGSKSLRFALGESVGKWKDFSVGNSPRGDGVALRGRRLHFRGYVYLESGSGVPAVRVRQSGKEGWITELQARPPSEEKGRWIEIPGSKVLSERATSFNIQLSRRPADANGLFYFDDFNLQPEFPQVAEVSLDRSTYFLSDANAFVTVNVNLGTHVLMPVRATLRTAGAADRLVTLYLKSTLRDHHIKRRTLRLTVGQRVAQPAPAGDVGRAKVLIKRDFPLEKQMKVPLLIRKLPEGAYMLNVRLVDDIGRSLFDGALPFSRIEGPFDY